MKTLINTVRYSIEETQEAATMLWKGGLVAIPTETVYGLTANARDGVAVQKIFDLKDRDYEKPISVLVSGMVLPEHPPCGLSPGGEVLARPPDDGARGQGRGAPDGHG